MQTQTYIFVYGTLKRGHCRAEFLNGQKFLGDATTTAEYRLFDCGSYPGLIQDPTGVEVRGEVWSIDADCLVRLDQVEAVAEGLYRRGVVQLKSPFEADTVESYFYLQATESLDDCGASWDGK